MPPAPPVLLIETIASLWSQIEASFSSQSAWRTFSGQLLGLLRELDDAPDDAAALVRRIDEVFATAPATHELLQSAITRNLPRPRPRGRGGLQSPWAAQERNGNEALPAQAGLTSPRLRRRVLISVLYGTDRNRLDIEEVRPRYGDQATDELEFGVATVSIPDDHHKGRLERPRWYRLEFRETPDRHVVLTTLEQFTREQLVAQAQHARERDDSNDEALVFVHGFNVEFEESIRRTAQFAHDLEFKGIAIAYTWPSKASLFNYAADGNITESSMFKLADFIAILRTELGLKRLHLVAHSMGNRLLARALNQHVLQTKPVPDQAQLNQIVFAAPDIDPRTFAGFVKVFADSCERCTLYASSRDLALTASSWIYRRPRAGASPEAVITYGVDAIDVTKVDSSMMGHSYFSDQRVLLQDLSDLLESRRSPTQRFGLTEIAVGAGRYWAFSA